MPSNFTFASESTSNSNSSYLESEHKTQMESTKSTMKSSRSQNDEPTTPKTPILVPPKSIPVSISPVSPSPSSTSTIPSLPKTLPRSYSKSLSSSASATLLSDKHVPIVKQQRRNPRLSITTSTPKLFSSPSAQLLEPIQAQLLNAISPQKTSKSAQKPTKTSHHTRSSSSNNISRSSFDLSSLSGLPDISRRSTNTSITVSTIPTTNHLFEMTEEFNLIISFNASAPAFNSNNQYIRDRVICRTPIEMNSMVDLEFKDFSGENVVGQMLQYINKVICAYLNGSGIGGITLFGINQSGTVKGMSYSKADMASIYNEIEMHLNKYSPGNTSTYM
jgi:hypothetical protein